MAKRAGLIEEGYILMRGLERESTVHLAHMQFKKWQSLSEDICNKSVLTIKC